VTAFDRISIAVPDLSAAVDEYRILLGTAPARPATAAGPRAWLALTNTLVELVPRDVDRAAVEGLVLSGTSAGADDVPLPNALGLALMQCDGSRSRAFRRGGIAGTDLAVDHVVLRTDDAAACIELFEGQLGIRLALDRTVPEWGGRMLFFRAGKLTLEVIEALDNTRPGSAFWGIAYQCADIDAFCRVLDERGVAHSAVRDGRKPGTRVASIKSHCLGIPTLVIEQGTGPN